MGEYNPTHKLHFICIDCRIGSKTMQRNIMCPHCGKPMIEVGVTFRIPKKTDNKAWKKVKSEIVSGKRYNSRWWHR